MPSSDNNALATCEQVRSCLHLECLRAAARIRPLEAQRSSVGEVGLIARLLTVLAHTDVRLVSPFWASRSRLHFD